MADTLENDMVSGLGDDRALSRVLRNDKGPSWDMRKPTWSQYWYEMYLFLCLMGFKDTVDGTNRMDMESDDDDTRNYYVRSSMCVWRLMTQSFLDTTDEAKSMRMQIKDDFGNKLDGFELIQYLQQYANEMSTTDVRQM